MPPGDRSSLRIEEVQPFPPPLLGCQRHRDSGCRRRFGLCRPAIPGHFRAMLVRCPGKFGREANDRGDDEVLGTYVQHPRDANRRLPRRSPRPRAVRGRGRLRGGQSLPLVARSPADERERSRAGTAPTAPRVGGQAPASASRPTQPEGGRRSAEGASGVECPERREHECHTETTLRTVQVPRPGYASRGHDGLHPLDAALNVPSARYGVDVCHRTTIATAARAPPRTLLPVTAALDLVRGGAALRSTKKSRTHSNMAPVPVHRRPRAGNAVP